MFLGRVPPKGFESRPGGRYRLPSDPRAEKVAQQPQTPSGERRRHERLQLFVNLRLKRPHNSGVMEEQTVTENISRRGAAVLTTLRLERGRFVRLTSAETGMSLVAVVRATRTGADNVPRLHLEFVDGAWPLEGLE